MCAMIIFCSVLAIWNKLTSMDNMFETVKGQNEKDMFTLALSTN